MIKRNRKGLSRAKWIEVFSAVLKFVAIKPKIEFVDGEITVNDFSVVPHDWEQDDVLHRGYLLIQWIPVPATYHDPESVDEREVGTYDTPYQVAAEIAKIYFEETLNGTLEGYEIEEQQKAEAKWEEELAQMEDRMTGGEVEIDHAADDGNGGGEIESELNTPLGIDELDNEAFDAAVHALESIILAHACAGVDVESPAYIEGIETASNKIESHFG